MNIIDLTEEPDDCDDEVSDIELENNDCNQIASRLEVSHGESEIRVMDPVSIPLNQARLDQILEEVRLYVPSSPYSNLVRSKSPLVITLDDDDQTAADTLEKDKGSQMVEVLASPKGPSQDKDNNWTGTKTLGSYNSISKSQVIKESVVQINQDKKNKQITAVSLEAGGELLECQMAKSLEFPKNLVKDNFQAAGDTLSVSHQVSRSHGRKMITVSEKKKIITDFKAKSIMYLRSKRQKYLAETTSAAPINQTKIHNLVEVASHKTSNIHVTNGLSVTAQQTEKGNQIEIIELE